MRDAILKLTQFFIRDCRENEKILYFNLYEYFLSNNHSCLCFDIDYVKEKKNLNLNFYGYLFIKNHFVELYNTCV